MKAILTIDYHDILLADDKQLGTLLKILSGACRVHDYTYRTPDGHLKVGPQINLQAKLVPDNAKMLFVDENDRPVPAESVTPVKKTPKRIAQRLLIAHTP